MELTEQELRDIVQGALASAQEQMLALARAEMEQLLQRRYDIENAAKATITAVINEYVRSEYNTMIEMAVRDRFTAWQEELKAHELRTDGEIGEPRVFETPEHPAGTLIPRTGFERIIHSQIASLIRTAVNARYGDGDRYGDKLVRETIALFSEDEKREIVAAAMAKALERVAS